MGGRRRTVRADGERNGVWGDWAEAVPEPDFCSFCSQRPRSTASPVDSSVVSLSACRFVGRQSSVASSPAVRGQRQSGKRVKDVDGEASSGGRFGPMVTGAGATGAGAAAVLIVGGRREPADADADTDVGSQL
jgi:hypothetical protein